jgi:hypothetical protein
MTALAIGFATLIVPLAVLIGLALRGLDAIERDCAEEGL